MIVPSDQRSAAHQMHQELSVLRGFVTGLSTGEVAWFVREGDKTVAEQIEDVFASVREKGLWKGFYFVLPPFLSKQIYWLIFVTLYVFVLLVIQYYKLLDTEFFFMFLKVIFICFYLYIYLFI